MPEQPVPPSPRSGQLVTGEFGLLDAGGPEVTIRERHKLSIVQVTARKDQAEAAIGAIDGALRLRLSLEPNCAVVTEATAALWIGPGQWLLVAHGRHEGELCRILSGTAGAHAALTDHSHGRCVVRIAGPATRMLLAKGCPLDLDPHAFQPGQCAQSLIGPFGALIHLVEAAPAFDLYVSRSYARSFAEWLFEAAAEFGYRVV